MDIAITNLEEMKAWLNENLIDKHEAATITEQSIKGFQQSVYLGKVVPFFEIEGTKSSNIKLYLKSDIEEYGRTKRK